MLNGVGEIYAKCWCFLVVLVFVYMGILRLMMFNDYSEGTKYGWQLVEIVLSFECGWMHALIYKLICSIIIRYIAEYSYLRCQR